MYHRPKLGLAYCIVLTILCGSFVQTLPTIERRHVEPQPSHNGNQLKAYEKKSLPQIEDTIDEVQKILANDPALPRLTRGEIEELYEKVTREAYEKSLEQGDTNRAESMRALMLVLPYNTDNNTEENLQELYTRPPVTKVVDSYTSHEPIKFVTADPFASHKVEKQPDAHMPATTYKPPYDVLQFGPSPTTYHPPPPAVLQTIKPFTSSPTHLFQPTAGFSNPFDYNQSFLPNDKPQRFSSHYNAKNADFLKKIPTTSTVKPVADVLENLGIVSNTQARHRYSQPDFYAVAESAPQPVISGYVPLGLNYDEYQNYQASSLAPKIRPDAYTNFKPLNIGEELRVKPEVERYLTRFGIVGERKRKVLEKNEKKKSKPYNGEQVSEESEIATAKVPSSSLSSSVKSGSNNAELMKLLENLQELERLNVKSKVTATTVRPTTSTTTTTEKTTTTPKSTTLDPFAPLVSNGPPKMIEPKKPRRRIDPNVDINFANAGNQQPVASSNDQLAKLLENLKELEKLQINPESVLKSATAKPTTSSTTTTEASIPRFIPKNQSPKTVYNTNNDGESLDRLLKELQRLEKQNSRTTTTTTTQNSIPNGFSVSDLSELRKLLSNDQQLQSLYEKARKNIQVSTTNPTTTTTTTSTTTTSTTTRPPSSLYESETNFNNDPFNFNNIEQLQMYLSAMSKKKTSTTLPTTSTTTTTSSTTTSTTPVPLPSKTVKKMSVDHDQLQELINRVQELERRNSDLLQPKPTNMPAPQGMGFTTRNINTERTVYKPIHLPANDFAHLQQLYFKVRDAEQTAYEPVEISTARSTAAKSSKGPTDFAQRLIDITNDTGSGSTLHEVDPDDFVQLQKLLQKVQELDRVKIPTATQASVRKPNKSASTVSSSLVTSASVNSPSLTAPNGAQIVYAEKPKSYDNIAEILKGSDSYDDLKLDLPTFPAQKDSVSSSGIRKTSSEELREYAYSQPANPVGHTSSDTKYQSFFGSLEDSERLSYQQMHPPVIKKTLPKEPPRFIATSKPNDPNKTKPSQKEDLKELQKLLNNAQELEKLGVTLPSELSQQIEQKLIANSMESLAPKKSIGIEKEKDLLIPTTPSNLYDDDEEPSERTAVFSLTTQKSAMPKEPRPTTQSSIGLPIFSATKIIEAAIKRAASKIGVSTETIPMTGQGFQRRIDEDFTDQLDENNAGEDLVGEFSDINYQLAAPEPFSRTPHSTDSSPASNTELQRLIKNLEELQRLNINLSPQQVQAADSHYLETLKQQLAETEESKKNRRQSASSTTTTSPRPSKAEDSSASPTRLDLSSGIDLSAAESDSDTLPGPSEKPSTTTEKTESTTEESRNGSLADLENSFGPDPNTESPPPPKKKNGFYFLADWNSFLEVGDGDDQVVVRFSPKIGDPRLFLPVKIP